MQSFTGFLRRRDKLRRLQDITHIGKARSPRIVERDDKMVTQALALPDCFGDTRLNVVLPGW